MTYDTEARDNRHEGSFLPLRAGDVLLQGDKGNGGEGETQSHSLQRPPGAERENG